MTENISLQHEVPLKRLMFKSVGKHVFVNSFQVLLGRFFFFFQLVCVIFPPQICPRLIQKIGEDQKERYSLGNYRNKCLTSLLYIITRVMTLTA